MNQFLKSPRALYAIVFIACFGLLATGYFMQYVMNLEPCPLCMVQRFFFYGVGIVALIGLLHGSIGIMNKLYSGLMALLAIGGSVVASRQLWLQSLPPNQVPSCGADFDFLVHNFPIAKAIESLWQGSPSCAEVTWTFLGLSIAGWAFIWFVSFALLALIQMFRSVKAAV
jgi:disulfide bond formation protein DsbB